MLEGASEGPRARLLRLQMEADELAREAVQRENDTLAPALLEQVRTLQARLERMQVSTAGEAIGIGRVGSSQAANTGKQSSQPEPSSNALAALDARVAAVEDRLGVQEIDGTELRPILPTLERLSSQVQLLSPAHLDAIRQRARLVIADLEQLSEAKKTLGDADYEKLTSLYELQRQIEPLVPVAPALLARLQTLEGLHAAAATFAERLTKAEATSSASSARLDEITTLLNTARTSLTGNMDVIHGNLSALEARITALDARVAQLSNAPP